MLERRLLLAAASVPLNSAITDNPEVQNSPSIAVDPLNPEHIVVSYMDQSLVNTGYEGIGVAVSENGGATWQDTSIPLPAGFDQGAANPTTVFDGQGHVFVSFLAATFLGPQPSLTSPYPGERPDGFQSDNGIFVARSDDGGLIWNTPVAANANVRILETFMRPIRCFIRAASSPAIPRPVAAARSSWRCRAILGRPGT